MRNKLILSAKIKNKKFPTKLFTEGISYFVSGLNKIQFIQEGKEKGMVKKIYFDMDGVLADFDKGIRDFCHMETIDQGKRTEEEDILLWKRVKETSHFYNKLDFMEGARSMFMRVYAKYGDKVEILSGIPKKKRGIETAKEDKIDWIHRLLSPQIKVNICYAEEKENFCQGPEYILIDDFGKNIRAWKEKGGSYIEFKNNEQVLKYFDLDGKEYNLVEKLVDKNYHIAFAESCTAGKAVAKLVNVPDASSVLNESFVTYANEAKIKYLDVKEDTIKKYGVVSEEVAREMAKGLCLQTKAEVGVAITGIAGPTGSTIQKPVGMVCFAVAVKDKIFSYTEKFGNIGRNNVRDKSVDFIYDKLVNILD